MRLQETKNLPDWGKMSFVDFPAKAWEDILPGAESDAIAFVKGLLVYESGARMTAAQVRICFD
jgi:hypothetical protein